VAIQKRPIFFLLISCLRSRFDEFIDDWREAWSARWLRATSTGKSRREEDEEICTESQNGRGWKGPLWVTQSNPPAEAASPTAGCRGPCPGGSGISPEKETPQPPWEPVPVLCHPQREEVLPRVQMELPLLQFVPVAPCPVAAPSDLRVNSGKAVGGLVGGG